MVVLCGFCFWSASYHHCFWSSGLQPSVPAQCIESLFSVVHSCCHTVVYGTPPLVLCFLWTGYWSRSIELMVWSFLLEKDWMIRSKRAESQSTAIRTMKGKRSASLVSKERMVSHLPISWKHTCVSWEWRSLLLVVLTIFKLTLTETSLAVRCGVRMYPPINAGVPLSNSPSPTRLTSAGVWLRVRRKVSSPIDRSCGMCSYDGWELDCLQKDVWSKLDHDQEMVQFRSWAWSQALPSIWLNMLGLNWIWIPRRTSSADFTKIGRRLYRTDIHSACSSRFWLAHVEDSKVRIRPSRRWSLIHT